MAPTSLHICADWSKPAPQNWRLPLVFVAKSPFLHDMAQLMKMVAFSLSHNWCTMSTINIRTCFYTRLSHYRTQASLFYSFTEMPGKIVDKSTDLMLTKAQTSTRLFIMTSLICVIYVQIFTVAMVFFFCYIIFCNKFFTKMQ